MKFKHILSVLMAIFCGLCAFAATDAADMLDRTAQRVRNAQSLTAEFAISGSEGLQDKGTMIIARERFAMRANSYAVWYDGTDLWSFSPAVGEVSLTTPTTEELLEINPFDILNHYSQRYDVTLVTKASGVAKLQLVAKSRALPVTKAVIAVNTSTWLPKAIDATFANGESVHIDILSMTEGAAPKSSAFKFPSAQYPGIEVVDLR